MATRENKKCQGRGKLLSWRGHEGRADCHKKKKRSKLMRNREMPRQKSLRPGGRCHRQGVKSRENDRNRYGRGRDCVTGHSPSRSGKLKKIKMALQIKKFKPRKVKSTHGAGGERAEQTLFAKCLSEGKKVVFTEEKGRPGNLNRGGTETRKKACCVNSGGGGATRHTLRTRWDLKVRRDVGSEAVGGMGVYRRKRGVSRVPSVHH